MKVLCIMSDGFEELEAVGTIALLRRAGINIDLYALDQKAATGRFNITISNIQDIRAVNTKAYDMLFLPGGPHYQTLERDEQVMSIIKEFFEQDKLISAICAAPTILGRAGYLKNKRYTCFTSMNEDFEGTYVDAYTVSDGNLIPGRSAAAVIDCAFAIIEKLCGKQHADEIKASIYYYEG